MVNEKNKKVLRALNQLLSYQLALNLMPFNDSFSAFISYGLKQIDGVEHCKVCLNFTNRPAGDLDNESCRDCNLYEQNCNINTFNCFLLIKGGATVIPVQIANKKFGYISVFTGKDFQPETLSAIKNFSNVIALSIENNLQKAILEKQNKELIEYQNHLEELVKKRTNELEQTNEKLQESEQRFRAIIENSLAGYFYIGGDGIFQYVNKSWLQMHKYNFPDEIIGKHFSITQVGVDIDIAQKNVNELFMGKQIPVGEFSRLCKDGSIGYHIFSCNSVMKGEKIIGIEGFLIDCSDRKQAEIKVHLQNDELLKLNKDKDRFMSILGHDLKNPFNSILGFLDLLNDNIRTYNIEKIEKQIGIISKSAHNIYNLLEDLLIWIRAQAGKVSCKPEPLVFIEIINAVNEELKMSIANKNLTISIHASPEDVVYADRHMLNVVLRNLVSNSIKFTYPGGDIGLYSEIIDSEMLITVSDNGIGIPAEKISVLFDSIEHYTTEGTAHEKGTGFGLPICKELIEAQGGKIWVESDPDSFREGKGTKFKFTLPLVPSI